MECSGEAWDQLFDDFKTYRGKDENKKGSGGPVRLDSYLWNAFSINTDPQCSVHDAPCAPPECGKNQFPAAATYILGSFSYLHQAVTTVWDSVVTNQIISQGDMSNFVQSFAERKDTTDEKTIKLIIDSVTFLLGLSSAVLWNDKYLKGKTGVRFPNNGKAKEGSESQEGNERSVWKDVSSASIAYGMTAGKDTFTIISLQNQLAEIMWANNTESRDKVNGMIADGEFVLGKYAAGGLGKLRRTDASLHSPNRRLGPEHWTCGDEVEVGGGKSFSVSEYNPGRYMDPGTNVGTHWCDNNDTSKYGISLEDIITSSYGGFLKNNKQNGYSLQSGESTVVGENWDLEDDGWPMLGTIQTPGFFNFTICMDPKQAKDNIMDLVHPPCGTVPVDAKDGPGGENEAGFFPGWCTIHITQFQPDQYKQGTHENFEYINPLNEYQLAVTLLDGEGIARAYATKQPVDGALAIESNLTYPLIVQDSYKGDDNKDMLSFWFNNQWWLEVDQKHECNIGAFDNGKREGSGNPPRATPTNIVNAFKGTGTPLSFDNAKDYKAGTCELHIRQYQQNEMSNYLNPGAYALELTLYDNDDALIAYTEKTNRAGGDGKDTVNIQGPLKWIVTCYSAKDDSTPPTCKYGAEDLTPGKKSFNNGFRDFSVKFNC
ncbi:uncharacterized protein N7482_010504 [Penicillium canariense]|uniref:Uncharacterized protein n=1 Tax=Penicillium canariense TaxID=189055 RepID=A0A9W9LEG1_9EURO|nr:uncharacterized protein N7482_010504 [Penicillium canariense]KAJ5151252.1 hypothetical protein N7482_010504 [Penicillium canariense]